jgi:hypothetical protein
MATAGRRQTAAEKIRDAESARDELTDALKAAGVPLPSLELDIPSCVGPDPLTLIELGCCNVQTARALAAVLRANGTKGTGR